MSTVEVTGNVIDAGETARAGVEVTAELVAASYQLAAGGQVARDVEPTVSDAAGDWSLNLIPISELQTPDGAYYVVRIGLRQFYVIVPDAGPVELGDIVTAPTALQSTAPVVKYWNGSAYALATGATIYVGGPTDPTQNEGDIWIAEV